MITINVCGCSRCGLDHVVVFQPLDNPVDGFDLWGMCPVTLQPVLLMIVEEEIFVASKEYTKPEIKSSNSPRQVAKQTLKLADEILERVVSIERAMARALGLDTEK